MSREKDIKALQQLKTDLNEAEAYAELANKEWEIARQIKAEMDNTKFEFKPLPTNAEEKAKASFKQGWVNFFSKTGKFKAVFLVLYSLAMAALAVLMFIAAYKNNGYMGLLHAPHKWDETPELVLTGIIMAAFPLIAAALPWAHVLGDDIRSEFTTVGVVALGISGLLFAIGCSWTNSILWLPNILIALVAAVLICFVIQLIFFIISKLPPIYTAKQTAELAAAKQQDAENAELNRVNEPKEKEEWEKWWAVRKPELRETGLTHISKGDIAMEKAKQHLAAAEESDIIGRDEKDSQIIDCLIHFLETRRADNIKEALHEYDNMKQNQKLLEIEAMKVQVEIEKAKKEDADRQRQMELNRMHQLEMEAQARRNADMQAQIAANTAAAAASAERMRKEAAAAADYAAEQGARIASTVDTIYRNEYYNN